MDYSDALGRVSERVRTIVVREGYRVERKAIDKDIQANIPNLSKYVPGFRSPEGVPAAKMVSLLLQRHWWQTPQVARLLLKGWYEARATLMETVAAALRRAGYVPIPVAFDENAPLIRPVADTDIRKDQALCFFVPGGHEIPDVDTGEATLMTWCLGWSVASEDSAVHASDETQDEEQGQTSSAVEVPDPSGFRNELNNLAKRLAKLGKHIQTAAKEAIEDRLVPDSSLSKEINSMAESYEKTARNIFDAWSNYSGENDEVVDRKLGTLEDVVAALETQRAKQRKASEAMAFAAKLIELAATLHHRTYPDWKHIQLFRHQIAEIQVILNSESDEEPAEIRALLDRAHPIRVVLEFLETQNVDDPALQVVLQAYGRELYTALITGRLALGPAEEPTAVAPPEPTEDQVEEGGAVSADKEAEAAGKTDSSDDQPETPATIRAATLAGSMITDEKRRSQRLTDLVWAILHEEWTDVAYHLVRTLDARDHDLTCVPPGWLLEAVMLERAVLRDVGESLIADRLSGGFRGFSEDLFIGGSDRFGAAIALLVLSASLRPALLAPGTGAYELLRQASQFVAGTYPELHEFSLAILEFCGLHCRFDLGAAKGQAYRDATLKAILDDAAKWRSEAPTRNMIYAPARALWRDWIGKEGRIGRMITEVASNNQESAITVKEAILAMQDEQAIKVEVQKACKDRRFAPIQAKALRHLCEHSLEAVSIARRWLEYLHQANDQKDDFAQKQSESLTARLAELRPSVVASLRQAISGPREIAAAAKYCGGAVDNLLDLASPESMIPSSEREPQLMVNEFLLRVPGLALDERLNPRYEGAPSTEDILRIISEGQQSWRTSFDSQTERRNHFATERILRILQSSGASESDLAELAAKRSQSVEESRKLLARRIEIVKERIEDAVFSALLREAERDEYLSRVTRLEAAQETLLDFCDALRVLGQIEDEIDAKHQEQKRQLSSKLDDMATDDGSSERIAQLIEGGDFSTAEDYLDNVARGLPLPEGETRRSAFREFFPETTQTIEEWLHDKNAITIVKAIRTRQGFPGVSLASVTGAHADRYAAAVEAWYAMKRSKKADPDSLRMLLAQMGFLAIHSLNEQYRSGHTWVALLCDPVTDRERCPVPQYGTYADGRYRILCLFERYDEAQVLELAAGGPADPPVLVLFFGRLTVYRRRAIAQLCAERKRTLVVIDELLLLSLCKSETAMLTLFECTLPFTFLNPYVITAGRVPREMFYGRRIERDSIVSPHGSCFIYGGRQLGKTSLLRDAEDSFHNPSEDRISVWIDLKSHGIGYDRPPDDLWSLIGKEFRRFGIVGRNDANVTVDSLIQRIESWLDENKARRILLLLDEADRFLEHDGQRNAPTPETGDSREFLGSSRLKGLMDRTERRFKVVFAGLHNVQRTTRLANHPLAHYGEPLCIGPLLDNGEWREAERLVRVPLEAIGYEISVDLVHRILALTNYYPSLIQLFCHQLIRHLTRFHARYFHPETSPPRKIESKHVEEAYRDENLRKAIRDRLIWTLQLDPRYEVIAYAMALEEASDDNSEVGGFAVDRVQELATYWWAEGFAGHASYDEFRMLLEEMVGLGILREKDGMFAFRNQNVVRLLGSEDEISKLLLLDREPPIEYEPRLIRRILRNQSAVTLSPFTAEQESYLRKGPDRPVVVFSSPLINANDLHGLMTNIVGERRAIPAKNFFVLQENAFEKAASTAIEKLSEGVCAVCVHRSLPWTTQHLAAACSVLKHKRGDKRRIVFVLEADPALGWRMVQEGMPETCRGIPIRYTSYHRWHETGLRQWIEEQAEYANHRDRATRQRISEVTGNWPLLLSLFHDCFVRTNKSFERAISVYAEELSTLVANPDFRSELGFDHKDSERVQILHTLAEIGEASALDLSQLGDFEEDGVRAVLKWASFYGYVERVEGDQFRVRSIIGRVVDAAVND